VFVLSEKGASSSAARWLANDQNKADLIGGVNLGSHDKQLASVLFDLSTTAQINDSMKLGKAVLGEIGGINRLHKGGGRTGRLRGAEGAGHSRRSWSRRPSSRIRRKKRS
jgi:hypothetical protein